MKNSEIGKNWLTEDELKILDTADKEGYFESPRKITLDMLAEKLGKNSRYVYDELNSINKKVLMKYIEQMNTPLRG